MDLRFRTVPPGIGRPAPPFSPPGILRPMTGGWRTAISQVRPGEIRIRGYDLVDLIGTRSFGDVVYLLLAGDLPGGSEGRMVEACLVAAAEHSVVAPSVDAARFVAS